KCLAHALQLAVRKTFYKCNEESSEKSINSNTNDSDSEDDGDCGHDEEDYFNEPFTASLDKDLPRCELRGEAKLIIEKVRKKIVWKIIYKNDEYARIREKLNLIPKQLLFWTHP